MLQQLKFKRSRLDSQPPSSEQLPPKMNADTAMGSASTSEVSSAVPGQLLTTSASQDSMAGPASLTGTEFLAMQMKDSMITLNDHDLAPSLAVSSLPDVANSQQVKNQRLFEYCEYKTRFPKLIPCDKHKLQTEIEKVLQFEDFKDTTVGDLNFSSHVSGSPVLDSFSIDSGVSLK